MMKYPEKLLKLYDEESDAGLIEIPRDIISLTKMNCETTSPSVLLEVEPSQPGHGSGISDSPSVPQVERSEPQSISDKAALPETKITAFALRLAILEKLASGLGKLAFIWATVVLLGGFAACLATVEFWFVTIILVTEGARIFSLSQEVDWQHETMLISRATLRDMKIFRGTLSMSEVPLALLWLQLLSASTCVVLSLYRLVTLHYGADSGSDTNNPKSALRMFYGLSFAESFLFLLEKAYWQWRISARELLTEVNDDYGFNRSELGTVQRFLYHTYSRCLNGSVLDGLKMEFVSYSVELLQSSCRDGQLRGTRVLSALANNKRFAEETLRLIGTMRDVVERLIEMLNFKDDLEQEIRKAAAEIISKLVEKNRNCIRVTAIAGSMESIASLLYSPHDSSAGGFISMGLTILQKLAEDRSNCAKIGSCKGLLARIIALTDLKPNASEFRIETAQLALELVKRLASTTGSTGNALRKGIRQIVFAISNLRDVLQYREISTHHLQILAIDTLTSLAREQEGRKIIGGTGGVLHNLFSLFFMVRINDDDEAKKLVNKAGEALGFLSFENKHNCEIMMSIRLGGRPNLIASLVSVLNEPVQSIHVARILRNLLAHAKADCIEFREITETAVQVLKFVMEKRSCEHQEAAIGLAAKIFKFMTKLDFDRVFEELSGVRKKSMISELVEVFRRHQCVSKEVPNIRRFGIELLIAVMKRDNVALEIKSELVEALESVMETTSEWENYSTFSGSVGLSRHSVPIQSLAESAMVLLSK